ncbi:hypothetical protein HIM_12660 [Hirsutella minnesotensis 3608]|uniref:Uncharacterized protein n=1 Tax=Hirsutella minnesotensis 3608 TaxID=1043627 RepID=A0A0F7ZET5_9HYPO|nr:hypothetical protein HIM_12660 [Hirsutella minnesotensis 3608]
MPSNSKQKGPPARGRRGQEPVQREVRIGGEASAPFATSTSHDSSREKLRGDSFHDQMREVSPSDETGQDQTSPPAPKRLLNQSTTSRGVSFPSERNRESWGFVTEPSSLPRSLDENLGRRIADSRPKKCETSSVHGFRDHYRLDGHGRHHQPPVHAASSLQHGAGSRMPSSQLKKNSRDVETLTDAVISLQKQVADLEQACGNLKHRNDALQAALDAQEEAFGRQESDSYLAEKFAEMTAQIKSWSSHVCRAADGPVIFGAVDVDAEYATSKPVDTFRGVDIWMPRSPGQALYELEQFLAQPEHLGESAFQDWRARTIFLLSGKLPPSEWSNSTHEELQRIVGRTMHIIEPLVPTPDAETGSPTELKARLYHNIFLPAVELCQVLRRQRARWTVVVPTAPHDLPGELALESGDMMDVDALDEPMLGSVDAAEGPKLVSCLIAPGLYKEGTDDGRNYDRGYHVIKAEVSCVQN